MKEMFWNFGILMAGLFGIVFIVLIQSITIDNESEYYVLKEAMEAAMLESVDITCYRNSNLEGCGEVVKISEQKFVENFTRRFVESVNDEASQYQIDFYDIIETPPKATVVIRSTTQEFNLSTQDGDGSFDIVNSLDGILIYEEVATKEENFSDIDNVLDIGEPDSGVKESVIEPEVYEDAIPVVS